MWKFKVFQRWLKSFWIKVAQFFSYCPVKKCESFWIFVWIFFSLNEDFKFWVGRNIVFRHFFYKCFQTISKNGHETRCWWKLKNGSLHSIKKKFNQRFKNVYTFLLDNKKRIVQRWFKTILTTSECSQITPLNFLSLKRFQEDFCQKCEKKDEPAHV